MEKLIENIQLTVSVTPEAAPGLAEPQHKALAVLSGCGKTGCIWGQNCCMLRHN
jgi:hypothetical protein